MNYIKRTLVLFLVVYAQISFAQSGSYDKLGMQAMMKGDYKGAVAQLEKADSKSPNNPSVLKMLGYSYFQCGNFESSIETYSRLITIKPSDYSAYYTGAKPDKMWQMILKNL
jgi:Flp pilus assembly protein TadD